MRDRSGGCVSICVVEPAYADRGDGDWVNTKNVDVYAVWVTAGHVKALDAAMPAKIMFGCPRIERVFAQRICAAQKPEPRRWHDQVLKSCHDTDRTVALKYFERGRSIDLKKHPAAMTAAGMRDL